MSEEKFSLKSWTKFPSVRSFEELQRSNEDACFCAQPHSAFRDRPKATYFAISNDVENIERENSVRCIEQAKTRSSASHTITLVNGIVFPKNHIVSTQDFEILTDSFRALGHLLNDGFRPQDDGLYQREVGEIVDFEGTGIVLGIHTNRNYFHWLLEAIPRLLLARSQNLLAEDAIIIGPPMTTWMLDILRFYGFGHHKFIELADRALRFNRLVVPARGIENIRTFTHHSRLSSNLAKRGESLGDSVKLFVSRAKSASRRIVNEEEVFALAEKAGYKRIFPEDLSFQDQVALFSRASHVCGCLGAGLTNSVFSTRKPRLIEFAPEGRTGDATLFANMMEHWDGEYACVVGAFDGPSDRSLDRRDIYIPLHLAEEALLAMEP